MSSFRSRGIVRFRREGVEVLHFANVRFWAAAVARSTAEMAARSGRAVGFLTPKQPIIMSASGQRESLSDRGPTLTIGQCSRLVKTRGTATLNSGASHPAGRRSQRRDHPELEPNHPTHTIDVAEGILSASPGDSRVPVGSAKMVVGAKKIPRRAQKEGAAAISFYQTTSVFRRKRLTINHMPDTAKYRAPIAA